MFSKKVEETNAGNPIKRMALFGVDSHGLYLPDQEWGRRLYAPPSPVL